MHVGDNIRQIYIEIECLFINLIGPLADNYLFYLYSSVAGEC